MSARRRIGGKERLVEFAVGFTFILAMVILGTYTIILKRDAFSKDGGVLQVRFADIAALQVGDKVLLRGLDVGKVAELELDRDGTRVLVHCQLTKKLSFHEDYVAEIRNSSVLGGRYIYLELGTPGTAALAPGTVLEGESPDDPFREATRVMENLNVAMEDIRQFTANINSAEGSLSMLINDPSLYNEAKTAFGSLDEAGRKITVAAEEVSTIRDDVQGLLTKADMTMDRISEAGSSVNEAGTALRDAGRSVERTSDNFNTVLQSVQSGKGTLPRLLQDDSLYGEIETTVKDIREAAGELKTAAKRFSNDDSSLTRIMTDEGKLYQAIVDAFGSMENTMAEARGITESISRGEGNLGKLVRDESLYEDVRRTVKEVQGAIEDFREQSPVSTFGGLVFGAL